jgi:hypothetical protein
MLLSVSIAGVGQPSAELFTSSMEDIFTTHYTCLLMIVDNAAMEADG